MPGSRRLRPVLSIVLSVLAFAAGMAGASAQELTPIDVGAITVTNVVIPVDGISLTDGAGVSGSDLTGEGSLIGIPTGTVTIGPAPSTSAPPPEAPAPASTIGVSDIPDRVNGLGAIFDIGPAECSAARSPSQCTPIKLP